MMIRQGAFVGAKDKKMLKGGLHCHTTRSDGRGTPEEVIRMHAEHGYDFLAGYAYNCIWFALFYEQLSYGSKQPSRKNCCVYDGNYSHFDCICYIQR